MIKFSCEKVLLQSAISVTSRAVAQKSSIPALEGLLIHADGELTVSGYNMQTGFNQLGQQISDCCCQTQRAIDGVNFNAERNTRDIIDSQRCGTDRIINFLTNQEMDRLRAENQTLRFQASQSAQNAYLVNELRPTARPAYITCSPYESAFGRGGWNACDCSC